MLLTPDISEVFDVIIIGSLDSDILKLPHENRACQNLCFLTYLNINLNYRYRQKQAKQIAFFNPSKSYV
jgi:hypothetical protein